MISTSAGPWRWAATPPPPFSPGIGAATTVWQIGLLRAGARTARGLRVPARNALLADIVPASVYGRAYGFERAMDNLGAIVGPLLAIGLVGAVGVRWAIGLSVIPGLLAALAIVYAIRHIATPAQRDRQPIRLRVRPVLQGQLGRLMTGITVFEVGNCAATLLILWQPKSSSRAAATITPPSSPSCSTSPTTWLQPWSAGGPCPHEAVQAEGHDDNDGEDQEFHGRSLLLEVRPSNDGNPPRA